MTIKQKVGITTENGIENYQYGSTVPSNEYPTIADCKPGSRMEIIDETNHKILGYKKFDGVYWNDYV